MNETLVQSENKQQSDKPTVLVVEDADTIRMLLAMNLRRQGYRALIATNGKIALQSLQKHPEVKAIILDMMMPIMNGPTFIKHARKLGFKDIPIIVLTGMNDFSREDRVAKLKQFGVHTVLTKPIDLDRLNLTLNELVPAG